MSEKTSSVAGRLQDGTNDNDALPAYSGPESSAIPIRNPASASSAPLSSGSWLPGSFDYSQYCIPDSTLSRDQVTRTVSLNRVANSPRTLENFLIRQAALPPRLEVRIFGTHDYQGSCRTDFDIRINLSAYLLRPAQERLNYIKLVEKGETAFRGKAVESAEPHVLGGISSWTERFWSDQSVRKSFVLERQVRNFDAEYIEGRLRTLAAALNYAGSVSLHFPVTHSKVEVQASSSESFMSKLMAVGRPTTRYEVLKSVWPFVPSQGPAAGSGHPLDVWWSQWREAIAEAIVEKRQGWLTMEDQIDMAMTGRKGRKPANKWGGDNTWH